MNPVLFVVLLVLCSAIGTTSSMRQQPTIEGIPVVLYTRLIALYVGYGIVYRGSCTRFLRTTFRVGY